MSEAPQSLLARFGAVEAGPEWLRELRRDAAARFGATGFPTVKHEDWKYTNLAPIAQLPFGPHPQAKVTSAQLESLAAEPGGPRAVFVNGRFAPELSRLEAVGGIAVRALSAKPDGVPTRFGQVASVEKHPLAALNAALATDAAVVEITSGATVPQPLQLVFVGVPSDQPTAAFPRVFIHAGAGSKASIVETYVSLGGGKLFTDAVTEVVLDEGAQLSHYKLQREAAGAFHIALLQATQAKGSHFASHAFALGASLARNEVRTVLGATGASCSLNGLYLPVDRQHSDNQTFIDHASPGCTSREIYKGVLDGASHGVFGGRVLVRPDASKTDAAQTNKNLLLSEEAQVDTKPQLEILTDDVKCAHGAAVGQLDENALFYLRSRGIGREEAKSLLTTAFVSEVVDQIPDSKLHACVRELVQARLEARG